MVELINKAGWKLSRDVTVLDRFQFCTKTVNIQLDIQLEESRKIPYSHISKGLIKIIVIRFQDSNILNCYFHYFIFSILNYLRARTITILVCYAEVPSPRVKRNVCDLCDFSLSMCVCGTPFFLRAG